MKFCNKCQIEKPLNLFAFRNKAANTRHSMCKPCHKDYRNDNKERLAMLSSKWAANNPEKKLASSRKRNRARTLAKYGLTEETYAEMVAAQDGRCLICDETPSDKLVVDHCHETEKVRGLLCRGCNAALGLLKDDPEVISRAFSYLRS